MVRIWLIIALGLASWVMPVFSGTLAVFNTALGSLEVELYDQQKPVTVNNFKRLVQSGAYQNTFFHRLEPNFVVQGGGFWIPQPMVADLFAPPWIQLMNVPHFGQITNEFHVGPRLSNTNGTIAMAKLGGVTNSATCQWFFNLANNSGNLDGANGGFTVFGRVVRDNGPSQYGGLLGLFRALSYGDGIVSPGWWFPDDFAATNLFKTLPVNYTGFLPPRYMDLMYVNISLLTAQVTITNQTRYVSWTSIQGKTNVLEYATSLAGGWQPVVATNGSGSRITIPDAVANATRFYRVRVLY